jgi:hypothetical protein
MLSKLSVLFSMVTYLVHIARCVVDSDNTSYIVIALKLAKRAKRQVEAQSSYRPVSSEARETARCREARCRDVALSLGT